MGNLSMISVAFHLGCSIVTTTMASRELDLYIFPVYAYYVLNRSLWSFICLFHIYLFSINFLSIKWKGRK